MTIANKLTFLRIVLAPLFFIIYQLPGTGAKWAVPVLWFIFIVSEITDLLDGLAARKYNEASDFGKFFDPFADTLMQLTCFLCFVLDGIFPAILFLLVIYREFSILFIRNLMLRKGVAMGARVSGKIKTVSYIIAGGAALLFSSLQRLSIFDWLYKYIKISVIIIFLISVVFSIISFLDYLLIYRKTEKNLL
jgi:CDP-diacylglycerol--glycerol-3-phosphate 3-phosphatidyltransferase